jgi:hypothetical protein
MIIPAMKRPNQLTSPEDIIPPTVFLLKPRNNTLVI